MWENEEITEETSGYCKYVYCKNRRNVVCKASEVTEMFLNVCVCIKFMT